MNHEQIKMLRKKYPAGTRVELVHMGDDPQKVPAGTLGTVTHIDDIGTIHVNWDSGSTLGVILDVDKVRIVKEKVIVRKPGVKFHADKYELAKWANVVHKLAGGKGDVFKPADFPERLKGSHCLCGSTGEGYSAGEFNLLPLDSEDVKEGGKAYMRCVKCGRFSHL